MLHYYLKIKDFMLWFLLSVSLCTIIIPMVVCSTVVSFSNIIAPPKMYLPIILKYLSVIAVIGSYKHE